MNICDIGNDLYDVSVGLHQIENLLQIYEEHIEEEVKFIQNHVSNGYISCFVERYDMLRSLLEIIQFRTNYTAASLEKQIDAINVALSEERQSPT